MHEPIERGAARAILEAREAEHSPAWREFMELSLNCARAREENGNTVITTGPACRAWREFGDEFRKEGVAVNSRVR
jgi:hypothetical protein